MTPFRTCQMKHQQRFLSPLDTMREEMARKDARYRELLEEHHAAQLETKTANQQLIDVNAVLTEAVANTSEYSATLDALREQERR